MLMGQDEFGKIFWHVLVCQKRKKFHLDTMQQRTGSLLTGGSAAGDFKLKHILVYHSEKPTALSGKARCMLDIFGNLIQNTS
jgi:hypothetical protein